MKVLDIFPCPKALAASINAGVAIMDVLNSSFTVALKKDKSPLTLADKSAHEIKVDILSLNYSFPILREKGEVVPYAIRKEWSRYGLTDPLNGTKEFVSKNGEFTVNISLSENVSPISGVIYLPTSGSLYFGNLQYGSYLIPSCSAGLDNLRHSDFCKLKERSSINQPLLVGSKSHGSELFDSYLNELKSRESNVQFLPFGSSLNFRKIAAGKANLYLRVGTTMEWDTTAGDAICHSLCIIILDMENKCQSRYNKRDLPNLHFLIDNRKIQINRLCNLPSVG
ncbi:MAG: 3'(2'), 5'-bisphosphate nucleotidase [Halieaceae bacterium]|jgi:3'(2'), 5'-bisphosphate nucleotidase